MSDLNKKIQVFSTLNAYRYLELEKRLKRNRVIFLIIVGLAGIFFLNMFFKVKGV